MGADLTVAGLFNEFLAISALAKTETQKNILTVLLRMYTHWAAQVGVLNSFNLSKVEKMERSAKAEEDLGAANATEEAPAEEEEEGLGWPPWYGELASKLTIMQEAAPKVGSVQMVIECNIDNEFTGDPKSAKYWKLVGPAVYWLSYPLLMVGWVILVAFIEIRACYPLAMMIVAATKKKDPE